MTQVSPTDLPVFRRLHLLTLAIQPNRSFNAIQATNTNDTTLLPFQLTHYSPHDNLTHLRHRTGTNTFQLLTNSIIIQVNGTTTAPPPWPPRTSYRRPHLRRRVLRAQLPSQRLLPTPSHHSTNHRPCRPRSHPLGTPADPVHAAHGT